MTATTKKRRQPSRAEHRFLVQLEKAFGHAPAAAAGELRAIQEGLVFLFRRVEANMPVRFSTINVLTRLGDDLAAIAERLASECH
jgi:hypothetical protein